MNQLTTDRPSTTRRVLSDAELHDIDAYWRACNYLALGMLYLRDNPLLREPLAVEHIKERLVGHWGSDPGQSFVWVHLNRLIRKYDLNAIYIAGPGHGAPATLANAYLEGRYSEVYPDKSEDEDGLRKFFKQFSFPGGIGSHCTPETPGSIHEGGELGYSVSHAFGAAFDNPDLLVTVVVGDGEAETGPLMGSLHSNKFLNPIRDGAVLPILHLNGYKIANPTISARISPEELHSLFVGFGWTPYLVEGDDPAVMHQQMAAALEDCVTRIRSIQADARASGTLRTTALADDHPAHAERLDGAEGTRRPSSGRVVARAPDPDPRRGREPGAPADAGGVDAPLPPGGTVRRGGPACSTAEGARADRRAADERQSPRQRRRAPDPAAACLISAPTPCR